MRKDRDFAALEIWKRLNELEKETVFSKFPESDIYDPSVRSYLFSHYKDKLIEVIVK
jgi:hypothetical protein